MTTFDIGRQAEAVAATHLRRLGYKVLAQNWRTRWCEVDIVASKDRVVTFVEVKYRQSGGHGNGLDYVTQKKIEQMGFAAESWVRENDWTGDYQLSAIEVSGANFDVTNFVDDIF